MPVTHLKISKIKLALINSAIIIGSHQKSIIEEEPMQDAGNLISVESDVNKFMDQELFALDSDLSIAFRELKVESLLNRSKIKKRSGRSAFIMVFDLCTIPFLMFSTVFIFARNQFDEIRSGKSSYYRFLENARYNWSFFIFWLSVYLDGKMQTVSNTEKYFALDDTINEVTGKLTEEASYFYDHSQGKTVLGYQKLVLGMFNGSQFIPINQKYCIGKKKPNAKSKAKKYRKSPKSERIPKNCAGAKERSEANKTKLEKSISMLRRARRQFKDVGTVLFDSWFCFNSFIIKIKKKLDLDVICQLKNLPRPNKYIYKGKAYTLSQLYTFYAKPKMRTVKKYNRKQAVLTVTLANSDVGMKIVFIHNEGHKNWHAFGSTDTSLSARSILEKYSQRWSIEVFFKNCKQYLNYGKEQVSNLDSMIASDAMVFLRYLLLTYLAYKDKIDFYSTLERNRNQKKFIEYGLRLLNYFMKRLSVFFEMIVELIENNEKETALELMRCFIKNINRFDEQVALI